MQYLTYFVFTKNTKLLLQNDKNNALSDFKNMSSIKKLQRF